MPTNPKPAIPTSAEPKPPPEPLPRNPPPVPASPKVERATWALAVLTGIVAMFTAALAVAAFLTMLQERRKSEEQLGVQTWLYLEQRSDSDEMTLARKKLAQELDPYDPKTRTEMHDDILEFFESVGALYNRNLLNKGLAASSFSWEATRWWEVSKDYIADERRVAQDKSLFSEFEAFAKAMREYEKHLTESDLRDFLTEQKSLETK